MNIVRVLPQNAANPQQASGSQASGSQASGSQANGTQVEDRVHRPANAFILYRRDRQEQIRAQNPELTNCQICELDIFAK
jgi:hypothetical protein